MIEIDGSFGEGGGQILRTSLALSMITGRPFRLYNIRANRRRGGLQPQHLTCVTAAAEVASADLSGAKVDSRDMTFRPRAPRPGNYRFDIGTAGSTSLVLQTVLPALLRLDEPSNVTIVGGTHNEHAPPFEFLESAFIPLVGRLGPRVTPTLERPGYYPAGGGIVHYTVEPSESLARLELPARGALREVRCRAVVSKLPRSIAERELETVKEHLLHPPAHGSKEERRERKANRPSWPAPVLEVVEETRSVSPGNCVLIFVESDGLTEVCTGFGKRGVPAERVARSAAEEAVAYVDAGAPVGLHLADQLLLPLALGAGGEFVAQSVSEHSRTNAEVIRRFRDVSITFTEREGGTSLVRVAAADRPAI